MDKANINTKEYWDEEWRKSPRLSRKLEKVIMSAVDPEVSVLDIGCGTGRVLRGLRKDKNCKVFGIDISEVAINALKRQGIEGRVANIEFFTLWDFDVIILSHTLEHIENDVRLLRRLWAHTDKYLIIAVPNDCMENEPDHLRKYSKESLTGLLSPWFKKIEDLSVGVHLILKCHV